MNIKITKGLDLSLEGEVNHQVLPEVKNLTSRVAVLGKDFHGIRPTMFVSEGQQVSQGEKLFEDKNWLAYIEKVHPMIVSQESKILLPTPFFKPSGLTP